MINNALVISGEQWRDSAICICVSILPQAPVSSRFASYFSLFIFFRFFFPFIFTSWRLITLQYCSGFCHTLTWISHGFTCIPHPDPHSHLPPHPIRLGLPSALAPSTCLMNPTWALPAIFKVFFFRGNYCVYSYTWVCYWGRWVQDLPMSPA